MYKNIVSVEKMNSIQNPFQEIRNQKLKQQEELLRIKYEVYC